MLGIATVYDFVPSLRNRIEIQRRVNEYMKMEQKDVPERFANVGRFWGTWGNVSTCRVIKLPQELAKQLVRTVRRAHIKVRKDWKYRRHFRDNGRSGFTAWDSAPIVRRITDQFLEDGVLHPT